MTIIKGNVKQFKNMFSLMSCGQKDPLFSNVVMKIDEEKIVMSGVDTTNVVATNQEFYGFIIEGSESINIETESINEVMKLFDDSDFLEFESIDNKVVLSVISDAKKDIMTIPINEIETRSRDVKIEFTDDSIIMNDTNLNLKSKFEIDTKYIRNQIKKGKFISDSYHQYDINLDNELLTLSINNIRNFELSSSTEIEVDGSGISTSQYSHGYDDIFKSLIGNVDIRFFDDKPMAVIQETEQYSIVYIIAPTIKSE